MNVYQDANKLWSVVRNQFNKLFTIVSYNNSLIRYSGHFMHASIKCFRNTLAYFATVVSYARKIFIKSTHVCQSYNTFFFVILATTK